MEAPTLHAARGPSGGRRNQQFTIGQQRMPNGQAQGYDEHGNAVLGMTPDGQTIIGYNNKGPIMGGAYHGVTPPANTSKNVGAISEPDVFSHPAAPAGYIGPSGLPQVPQQAPLAPVQGQTPGGATVDASKSPAAHPTVILPPMAAAMTAWANRNNADGSKGQQTQVQNGDPGTVTAVGPARVADATENHINSFMQAQANPDGNKEIASGYGKGSVRTMPATAPSYAGDTPPPPGLGTANLDVNKTGDVNTSIPSSGPATPYRTPSGGAAARVASSQAATPPAPPAPTTGLVPQVSNVVGSIPAGVQNAYAGLSRTSQALISKPLGIASEPAPFAPYQEQPGEGPQVPATNGTVQPNADARLARNAGGSAAAGYAGGTPPVAAPGFMAPKKPEDEEGQPPQANPGLTLTAPATASWMK